MLWIVYYLLLGFDGLILFLVSIGLDIDCAYVELLDLRGTTNGLYV
jgi:hypothetical protein